MNVVAQAPLEKSQEKQSRFQRTFEYLQGAPVVEQTDFVLAALSELAAVYMAEADLARADAVSQTGSGRAKLLGWSRAVDQYASQLLLVLDDLEQGYPVSLRTGTPGPPTISVADRAVILGHPRDEQQSAFEQRVLADFCSRHDCRRMTQALAPEPIPDTLVRVYPLWTFAETGPVCSNDGLEVQFHSTRNIANLRRICEQLAQELASLATALVWQRRHGVDIDWSGLSVEPTPGRPGHLVRLNAAGDSVLLTVPLLFSSENLLADITPWLHALAKGEKTPSLRLDAGDYGWVPSPR